MCYASEKLPDLEYIGETLLINTTDNQLNAKKNTVKKYLTSNTSAFQYDVKVYSDFKFHWEINEKHYESKTRR